MCKSSTDGAGFGQRFPLLKKKVQLQLQCEGEISPTYKFVVDIFQEGQLWLQEVHSHYGDVFAPWDVKCPQTVTVLNKKEQGFVGDVITAGEVEMLQSA